VILGIGAFGYALGRWLPAIKTLVIFILVAVVIVQILLSIRRVYRQGWFMTIFKFFLGGFVYLLVLLIGLGATTVVTLAQ
jgi:sugar phosphate permease